MNSYFKELLVPSPRAILAVDIVIKATLRAIIRTYPRLIASISRRSRSFSAARSR
jgi:hypothetical protein